MGYEVSDGTLEKYANVLIRFALNSGKGVKKGETVLLQAPESAKRFLPYLIRAVLKAGANPILNYSPQGVMKEIYELSSDEQLKFFPAKLIKGRVDEVKHYVDILSEANMHELEGVSPKKIMMRAAAYRPYSEWRSQLEAEGKNSRTMALYGTEAMAKEAGLSLEEYWNQIIKACYLDESNPIKKWNEIFAEVDRLRGKLNSMKIEKVRMIAEGTDLIVGLGKDRTWLGGSGANIPSFEVFISPDRRKTSGKIRFDKPLYRYGNLVEGIEIEFRNGKVVKASARKGEKILKEMIKTKNANMIGEFSLTDVRLSKIGKFMAETLFDENFGGEFGNSHVALGNAYRDSYPGKVSSVSESGWKKMGYNKSVVHTDIVNGMPKEVIATLHNGKEIMIYKNGKFLV